MSQGVVSYKEFKSFFRRQWSPMIADLHKSAEDILDVFLEEVCAQLELIPMSEVCSYVVVSENVQWFTE